MAIKNKMIEDLADKLSEPRPVPKKDIDFYNPLTGKDLNIDVVAQFEKNIHPRFIHQVIRSAQKVRLNNIDDSMAIYSNKTATLTVYEKNFIYAYESAVREGNLLQTLGEVDDYISKLIEKQNDES